MSLPKWDQLTQEQKNILAKLITKEKWDELNDGVKDRFADSIVLGELLAFPTIGRELPIYRKWTLPDPPLPDPRKELEKQSANQQSVSKGKSHGQGTP